MNLKQAVVFAILMEHGEGILGKSPDYIFEKFNACDKDPDPCGLLDNDNLMKFRQWKDRWTKSLKI